MVHTSTERPAEIHAGKPHIMGIDQGSNAQGMRVLRCDGMLGRIDGPHCTYGATVQWDDGTRYYIDSACLTRVHWRVSRTTDGANADLVNVTEHGDYASALDAFRCLLDSIAVELFGGSYVCECDTDECEPCESESDARSWLANQLTGRTEPGALEFAHRPGSWGITALFRLERV